MYFVNFEGLNNHKSPNSLCRTLILKGSMTLRAPTVDVGPLDTQTL